MKISKEQVLHIARLARLRLEDGEQERFQEDLNSILDYMDLLNEVHTDNVRVAVHTLDINNAMRNDGVVASQDRVLALKNAPETKNGNIVVPKILD